jgi:hypothetical protein
VRVPFFTSAIWRSKRLLWTLANCSSKEVRAKTISKITPPAKQTATKRHDVRRLSKFRLVVSRISDIVVSPNSVAGLNGGAVPLSSNSITPDRDSSQLILRLLTAVENLPADEFSERPASNGGVDARDGWKPLNGDRGCS